MALLLVLLLSCFEEDRVFSNVEKNWLSGAAPACLRKPPSITSYKFRKKLPEKFQLQFIRVSSEKRPRTEQPPQAAG